MSLVLAIVDYDAGNLRSVQRACAEVGVPAVVTASPNEIREAERVIFPGVGAAGPAMRSIRSAGIDTALVDVFNSGRPLLGICMGLQICLEHSEEDDTSTLGMVPGQVCRFRLNNPKLKIPHMGWNNLRVVRDHPVLQSIDESVEFYFVHAYYPQPKRTEDVIAVSTYEKEFCCVVGFKNFVGTQFHPEKSGRAGLSLLERFVAWEGNHA